MKKIGWQKRKLLFYMFKICYIIDIKFMNVSQGKMSQGKIFFQTNGFKWAQVYKTTKRSTLSAFLNGFVYIYISKRCQKVRCHKVKCHRVRFLSRVNTLGFRSPSRKKGRKEERKKGRKEENN